MIFRHAVPSRFTQGTPNPEGYPRSLVTINQFILAPGISSGPLGSVARFSAHVRTYVGSEAGAPLLVKVKGGKHVNQI